MNTTRRSTNLVVRGMLTLIPARWRASVIRDLEEEGDRHGWGRVRLAWHALSIATTMWWLGRRRHETDPTRGDWMGELRRDVAFALRLALRTPLFTLLAVVTLALGVGANAAVFGVTKSVLLDPLPYADDDQLVRVYGRSTHRTSERTALSAGAVMDYTERQTTLDSLALFFPATWEVTYRPPDGPRVLTGGNFSPGFLDTLGVSPVLGRSFRDEETTGRGIYVAMLSHDMWQREFGGAPDVVGRSIRVDADAWNVVGVLPRGFTGPMGSADIWFALDISSSLDNPTRSRASEWLGLVARLNPGVPLDAARSDLSSIAASLAREHPDTDGSRSVTVMSLRESMVGDTRTPLLVLMGSAALVLVIACANLAGAFLSRSIGRRGELAVRVALGAGRGRLVRQLLTEGLVIAIAGLLLGVLLAGLGIAALRQIDVPALPVFADLSLDAGALLFASLVALGTGLAIGIVPALTASRSNTQRTLRDSTRSLSEGVRPSRLRGVLLSVQIALSLSLLVGAGLLTRSLLAMAQEPLGFDPEAVLTLSVKGPIPERDAVRKQFFETLEERIRALPGVIAVANTNALPGPGMDRRALTIQGAVRPTGPPAPLVPVVTVSDDWFGAMRIPLREGRGFGPTDRLDTTPVVVISHALARAYWPGAGALGARIRLGDDASAPWAEVVGIAGDVRTDPVRVIPEPMVYAAARQASLRESRIYAVRTEGDPLALARPVRAEVAQLDPTVPMSDVSTLSGILDGRLNVHRLPAFLMAGFALLALMLASVGAYALFGNLTSAREQEFSLRMALGSSSAEIAWLILRHGALWTIAGLVGGAIGIGAVGYALRDLLYKVSPHDPVMIGIAIVAIVASGAIALIGPLRRAIRLDPCAFLRG